MFRADDGWHMLITARDPTAERLFDGVLAHARSTDMRTLGARAAADRAGRFGQLEVSQVRCVDGQWLLLFTCHPDEQGERTPFCTWYVLGDSPLGPWDIAAARPFEDEPNLFAAPLVQRRDGSWAFLGFIDRASFDIVDPIPVELREEHCDGPRRDRERAVGVGRLPLGQRRVQPPGARLDGLRGRARPSR